VGNSSAKESTWIVPEELSRIHQYMNALKTQGAAPGGWVIPSSSRPLSLVETANIRPSGHENTYE